MTIAKDGIVIQRGPSATIAIKPAAPNKVKRNVCQKVIEYLWLSEFEYSEKPEFSISEIYYIWKAV